MKKIIIIIALLVCVIGCSSNEYIDSNGLDNYNLQTLTDEDIINNLSYTATGLHESEKKGIFYKSCSKLNGIMNLEEFTSGLFGNDLIITVYSIKIIEGNAKIVICDDNSIYKEFNICDEKQSFEFNTKDSPFYLRIAGESCKFEIEYQYYAQ